MFLQPRTATSFCSIPWWWMSVLITTALFQTYAPKVTEGVTVLVHLFFTQMISQKSSSIYMRLRSRPWRSVMRTTKISLRESLNGRTTGRCTWSLTWVLSKFFVEAFKMLISGHGDMWLYASPFRKRLMTLQDSTTGVGTFWKKRSRELTCRKVCLRWEFLCCFSKNSITVSRCQHVRYSLRRHFKDVILDELANKRRWRKTPLLYCRFCPTDGDIKWLSLSGSGAYVCSSKAFQKLM